MDKHTLINQLDLRPHPEGGYFRRTYSSPHTLASAWGPGRLAMSAIYYLLTDNSPIGRWHRNHADILHFHQLGSALTYWIIDPRGHLTRQELGPELDNDQQLQLLVPGGYWKATELTEGSFALLSEAVSPGFEASDCSLADSNELARQFPTHRALIQRLTSKWATP